MSDVRSPREFRRWDDGFVVRSMTVKDAETVIKWYSDICPTSFDLDIVLKIRPDDQSGFYIGELNGEVIASKVQAGVCDGVSYGSLFYVDQRYRMSGYGRRINDVAAEFGPQGHVVCIDAHDELEQMNIRRGYTTAFKVTQYTGKVQQQWTLAAAKTGMLIKQIDDSNIDAVVDYDDRCFVRSGSEWRHQLLKLWTSLDGGRSVVAFDGQGHVIGFACRRPAALHRGHELIGPLYADSLDIAKDLFVELTRDVTDATIWINICEPNVDSMRLVDDFQLSASLHMIRMHRNGDAKELNHRVFAVTSIDVCGF